MSMFLEPTRVTLLLEREEWMILKALKKRYLRAMSECDKSAYDVHQAYIEACKKRVVK